ncbi:hypothetical protein [Tahibacter amnicola]|uniref:ATP-grasp domain-containing protein n=1 Tax=Tahibacter amnicola TaxID=2976241 RepID=A0ABY6BM19_9GAMM|nr:hypothetical protein [Tahibacter amnicola]UXI70100.1 hypothetical protein N4264_10865 [Tahibacter amnicola]
MRILFYPQFPAIDGYTLVAICHELGYQGVASPEDPFDIAVAWADETWLASDPVLEAVARERPVWNIDCRDISKRRVDVLMHEVFGYGAEIDPRRFHGVCAVKTDENARGRGSVVQAPTTQVDPAFVYQRYIQCSEHGHTVNYRVPVIAGSIPVCYVLGREPPLRVLKTDATSCRLESPDVLFSRDEQRKILQLCEHMGLDFGELDVLRDDADGRLYVIDVNKTPAGMGIAYRHKWTVTQRRDALHLLARAFDAAVKQGLPRRRGQATEAGIQSLQA